MILSIENITGGYRKDNDILNGISFKINEGEILAVIGQNGAGKSTLAKAIVNILPFRSGKVLLKGTDITKKSTENIIKLGIGYFLQGGRVFPHLNIYENLKIAGYLLEKAELDESILMLRELFPVLSAYKDTKQASELSGGEKHQLSLSMIMLNKPKLLILDEPSAGLSPQNIQILYNQLQSLRKIFSLSILLIEQNIKEAINNCDHLIILSNGIIAKTISREELNNNISEDILFKNLVNLR